MRSRFFGAVVALAVMFPASSGARTWQDVRGICAESQAACWFYILGLIDAVRYRHQNEVCIPANVTQDTAIVVVDHYSLQFPAEWPNRQAYDFVFAALAATYPCPLAPGA